MQKREQIQGGGILTLDSQTIVLVKKKDVAYDKNAKKVYGRIG
jgi:hypothetical protein